MKCQIRNKPIAHVVVELNLAEVNKVLRNCEKALGAKEYLRRRTEDVLANYIVGLVDSRIKFGFDMNVGEAELLIWDQERFGHMDPRCYGFRVTLFPAPQSE